MVSKISRLPQLDFLRGIAITLVLTRHSHLPVFVTNVGWIGVDLFFVLSGFLVSGLLFREYKEYGNIKPLRFIIRRGFKIYPLYYIFYLFYLVPIIYTDNFNLTGFLSDMFFVQNYIWEFGYAYSASWSLAIEEHFYISLALLLSLIIGYKNNSKPVPGNQILNFSTEKIIISFMSICLLLRIVSNILFPNEQVRNFSMTHLRIDSLLAGVLVSYIYYFKNKYLKRLFIKYKKNALVVSFLLISFAPFFDALSSFFVKTIGFTMLYIAFSIILIYVLMHENIQMRLNNFAGSRVINFISKLGIYSYSIYIIHTFINTLISYLHINNPYLEFALFFAACFFSGKLMTLFIERYFLRIRDKYFPSRVKSGA